MSVFTPLERAELEAFLAPYGLGRLLDFQGIAAGVENSNYFISLEQGEFVLTLIERGPLADLPFFLQLLERLHQAQLPVPFAIATTQGETLRQLAEKPALLQPRLPGKHVLQPNAQHCAEIGRWLAHLHTTTQREPLERASDRGLAWMLEEGPLQAMQLDGEALQLLRLALEDARELSAHLPPLPRANLHADLFRDNALFDGNHLSGVIDFYNACSGPMLYDLAIALNDWCLDEQDGLDPHLTQALLGAYAALRPFTRAEANAWPLMLRVACLRFWLSRLIAASQPAQPGVRIKPPAEFQQRLQLRREQPAPPLPLAL